MGTFQIEGGHALKGEIQPQGAKNEALQILCAVLLTPEKVTIHNIPDILDVNKLINILKSLGVRLRRSGRAVIPSKVMNSTWITWKVRNSRKKAADSAAPSCWWAHCWEGSARDIFQDPEAIK